MGGIARFRVRGIGDQGVVACAKAAELLEDSPLCQHPLPPVHRSVRETCLCVFVCERERERESECVLEREGVGCRV